MNHRPFALAVASLALTLPACPRAPQRPPPLPATPEARLAAVRAEEDGLHSLRARFSSVTHLAGDERSADGVLLVAKPDRFRLRLMLPFGLTVFDYLNVGDRTWMTLPLADPQQRAHAEQFAPFSRDDLGQVFLRGAYAFPGACTAQAVDTGRVAVQCRVDGTRRRSLLIGDEGIVEETSYAGDTPRMVIRYADYRGTLPYRITLEYPQRQQSVDITIEQYEVNPTLSDDLFRPPADSTPQSQIDDRWPDGARSPSADT